MEDKLYFDLLKDNLFNIYDGSITFFNEDETCLTKGKIFFKTSPYPQVLMKPHEPITINGDIDMFPYGYEIKTLKNHSIYEGGSETYYDEKQSKIIQDFKLNINSIKTRDTEVEEVVIFIMNCSHIGLTFLNEKEYKLEHDDWQIQLKFRPDKNISNHYKNLRNNRSYEITHVGTISKKTKKCFKTSEITKIISKMEWYLSFCSAQCVFIPIQFGFKDENRVWENYHVKDNLTHYQDNHGWVPIGAVSDFNNFFSNVANKLEQELWSNIFISVLNWYLEIKSNGMNENRIIATQAALEQLAWTYLVNQEQMLDKEAYKKLRATDIFRLLCYQLKIPINIVSKYPEKLIKKYNNDGIYMFVDFRNNFVHPERKTNDIFSDIDSKYTAYSQGLYFLEKIILGICGYGGTYENDWESLES